MVILVSIIVIAIALVGILGMALRAGEKAPAVGSEAPDFTLNSQDGKPVSLHDYKGKWVVLYFYPKDMTPGCTIEAHNFERDLAKYDAKNAVILGVSMQGEKSHQEFCAKESLTFKLLSDTKSDVSGKYDSVIAPHVPDRPERRRSEGVDKRRRQDPQRRRASGDRAARQEELTIPGGFHASWRNSLVCPWVRA
jgi:peroxiredoxin Q/BCP